MPLHRSRFVMLVLAVFSLPAVVRAEVKLPRVFSDHMVLQQAHANPIWGWSQSGESVTVELQRGGQTIWSQTVKAADNGEWKVATAALDPGEPLRLIAGDSDGQVKVEDILVGEVWIASGQSNMAMTVSRARDAKQEIARANDQQLRMFTVARKSSAKELDDCSGSWAVCSPESAGRFSATAYYFARQLRAELKVPVGIVHASWGGTAVEAWTSPEALQTTEAGRVLIGEWDAQAKSGNAAKVRQNQNHPGNLFRGMISPVVGFGARGAIWYQGERNSRAHSDFYGTLLTTLISDWRQRWGQERLDFYWVQLPNFQKLQQAPSETSGWVLVREGMLQTLSVPHTGMAITTDIGEANDIHPKNKQDVGMRLALAALAQTYGQSNVASGPIYHDAETVERDGRTSLAISFHHTAEGLKPAGGGELKGFAVSGADREWKWATARIADGKVIVSHPEIKEPVACRYGWAANPIGNLVNSAGLPASPFRTDDWDK